MAGRNIVARFDGGDLTSDASLLLLAQADCQLGLIQAITDDLCCSPEGYYENTDEGDGCADLYRVQHLPNACTARPPARARAGGRAVIESQ
jgi:hypothetical protein